MSDSKSDFTGAVLLFSASGTECGPSRVGRERQQENEAAAPFLADRVLRLSEEQRAAVSFALLNWIAELEEDELGEYANDDEAQADLRHLIDVRDQLEFGSPQ